MVPADRFCFSWTCKTTTQLLSAAALASMPPEQVQREYGWFFETLHTRAVPNMPRLQEACTHKGHIEVLYTVIENCDL